jgi:hypothetical protein
LKERLFNGEIVFEWSDTFNTNASAVHVGSLTLPLNCKVLTCKLTTVAFLPLLQAGEESHGDLSASVDVISSMSGIMRRRQWENPLLPFLTFMIFFPIYLFKQLLTHLA